MVDVDQDGITDILLIAAPMFLGAGNKETGKVYVYCLDGVRSRKGKKRALFTFTQLFSINMSEFHTFKVTKCSP